MSFNTKEETEAPHDRPRCYIRKSNAGIHSCAYCFWRRGQLVQVRLGSICHSCIYILQHSRLQSCSAFWCSTHRILTPLSLNSPTRSAVPWFIEDHQSMNASVVIGKKKQQVQFQRGDDGLIEMARVEQTTHILKPASSLLNIGLCRDSLLPLQWS